VRFKPLDNLMRRWKLELDFVRKLWKGEPTCVDVFIFTNCTNSGCLAGRMQSCGPRIEKPCYFLSEFME